MNKLIFDGNIGADATQKTVDTSNGPYSFWTVPIAMNKRRKKDAPDEKAEWIDCALHGKKFENLAPHLTKGKKMFVCGDVELRRYTAKDGTNGARLQCAVDTINFAESKSTQDQNAAQAPAQNTHNAAKSNGYAPTDSNASFDDDIPF